MMNYSNSFGCYTVGKMRHRLFCGEGIKATKYSWDLSNLGQMPREIAVVIGKVSAQGRRGRASCLTFTSISLGPWYLQSIF